MRRAIKYACTHSVILIDEHLNCLRGGGHIGVYAEQNTDVADR